MIIPDSNSASSGYDIDNSLKLESDNSEELYQTLGTPTSTKIMTFSFWIKRPELATSNDYIIGTDQQTASPFNSFRIFFEGDTQFSVQNYSATVQNTRLVTPNMFRDTAAWYHFVAAIDTTQATASNRMKLYINGVQKTDWTSGIETQPGQNEDIYLESGRVLRIGSWKDDNGTIYYVGGKYLSEMYFVDGQQLAASDFGEFDEDTGIWKPKAYTGTYGNNGFYLDFEDSASLGADDSGNGNNFTLSNITSADQATDTPTNNFCAINAVNLSTQTLTEGATKIVSTDNSSRTSFGTMAVSKGKWWWEGKIQVYESNTTYPCIGVTGDLDNPPATSAQSFGSNHVIKLAKNQKWLTNDTGTLYGTTYADNDIINIALDMDNHIMYTYKNGTIDDANGINFSSQSAATAGDFYIPINLVYVTGGGSSWEMNFGGFANYTISSAETDGNGYGTFEYAPPSGYYALCSKNLAEYG